MHMTMKQVFGQQSKLSNKRMYFICQQLSFALESGMPLPAALQLAAEETTHHVSRRFLMDLYQAMEQGHLASEALLHTSVQYSSVFLEFILAGEQNGTMKEALSQAAEYFQQQNKTKQMLFSALCYPAVLLVLMVFAFGAMLVFVVPAVVSTYQNLQAELPQFTQVLLHIGTWLKQYGMILSVSCMISLLLAVFGFRRFLRNSVVRNGVKTVVLKIPLIGSLYQQYWFIQITQGLGLMLNSGMLLVNGLAAIAQIYSRSLFSDELLRLRDRIISGYTWANALEQCSFIPNLASQMLIISEQSGTLPRALIQLNQYYQRQFQQKLQVLMSILEPCVIIVLGLGILAIAGSLFLPLVQSYQYML